MDYELIDIIIPSVAFFIAFYMAFNLLELIVILILNRLIFRYWGFFVDRVMYAKVNYGTEIERVALVVMVFFLFITIRFTAVIDVIIHASLGIQALALVMLVDIILIYFITTRKVPKSNFMKRVHSHLFVYISTVVYILVITLSNQYYARYQKFINAVVVSPIQASGASILENNKRKNLLAEFREQIDNNGCTRVNYVGTSHKEIPHFIYITTHRDLKIKDKPINSGDPKAYLSGRLCSNSEQKFLLTDYGQWYWAIDGSGSKS